MKTINKSEKKFDAVKMMRETREKLSIETQNMSFEELKIYIQTQLNKNNYKKIGS